MNGRTNSNPSATMVDVTKSPFATLPPSDLVAHRGNQKIDIGWTNPVTEKATPSGYTVAKRAYTILVRNDDHAPADRNDGTLIYTDTDANESSVGSYSDTGLVNGHAYYYGLIAVTDNEISSEPASISMVPSMGVGYDGELEHITIPSGSSGPLQCTTANNEISMFIGMDPGYPKEQLQAICYFNAALVASPGYITISSNNSGNTMDSGHDNVDNFGKYGIIQRGLNRTIDILVLDSNGNCTNIGNSYPTPAIGVVTCLFNDHVIFFGGFYSDINGYFYQNPWIYKLSESLTFETGPSYTVDGVGPGRSVGIKPIGKYCIIGPRIYTQRNPAYNTYYARMQYDIINSDLAFMQGGTFSNTFALNDSIFKYPPVFQSNGSYVLYGNGADANLEPINEELVKTSQISAPFSLQYASNYTLDEYIIFLEPLDNGRAIAYDQYLTMTYPANVINAHSSNGQSNTVIQNHAIFANWESSKIIVDAYSI